ncbi:MAG: TetR/AcrR family transcriptional regulator [Deltaproteobacteria bacterium]|nr:TetR/AcrR family transcriptional regulator [Deltaproteobacteria bacterium]
MKSSKIASDPRKREKYLAIIDAALEAFAEYGYHDCQVAKIARRAGIADGTIYLYFANKEDILISVFQEKMSRYLEEVRAKIAGCDDPWEQLAALVRFHLENSEQNPVLANFFQIQLRQSSPQIRSGISGPLRQYYRLIEEIITAGIARGRFDAAIDPKIAREMVFGSLDEIVSCWVIGGQKFSLAAQVPGFLRLLRGGLVTG